MIRKLLNENFTKKEFINFIIDNDIYEEFFLWLTLERKKNERDKKSNKLFQDFAI